MKKLEYHGYCKCDYCKKAIDLTPLMEVDLGLKRILNLLKEKSKKKK